MASFNYEIKSGTRWGCRGYLGVDEATGKQINFEKRGFKAKKEADLYFLRQKLAFEEGQLTNNKTNITFNDLYAEWLEVYKNTDIKESTFAKTTSYFEIHILEAFGRMKVNKITASHIQPVVNDWHKRFKLYTTLFSNFKRVMEFGRKHGYINQNPCDLVELPKRKLEYDTMKSDSKKYYNRKELENFNSALDKMDTRKWHCYFRILSFCGLRRAEALALKWSDINFTSNTLEVNRTITTGLKGRQYVGDPKTKESKRVVSFDAKTAKVMKQWRHEQAQTLLNLGYNALGTQQYMFSKLKDNQPLNLTAPRNALEKICNRFELPMITIHGFRHTHCTMCFEAGMTPKQVMDRLGHSDSKITTEIYYHVTENSREKSTEKLERYINF